MLCFGEMMSAYGTFSVPVFIFCNVYLWEWMINQNRIIKLNPQKMISPLCPQSAGAMALVHPDPPRPVSDCHLQRPLLCHRVALPNAPLCHCLHRRLPLEDESRFGRHHVCAVLCLPRPQHPVGGASHHLPRVHLTPRVDATPDWSKQRRTDCMDQKWTVCYRDSNNKWHIFLLKDYYGIWDVSHGSFILLNWHTCSLNGVGCEIQVPFIIRQNVK